MKTVNLVATLEAIGRYHHSPVAPHSSVMSADFPIVPETCKTELGLWLAQRILTTRFEDDAATCTIVLPYTEQGLQIRSFADGLVRHREIRTVDAANKIFKEIEDWVAKQRQFLAAYGPHTTAYRTTNFKWPVFGAAAAQGANTPEDYFDLCAGMIRATGGAILHAGLQREPVPESLLRTMAAHAGGGVSLVKRYNEGVAAMANCA